MVTPVKVGDLHPHRYRTPRGSVLTVHAGRIERTVWGDEIRAACDSVHPVDVFDAVLRSPAAEVTCKGCRRAMARRLTRTQHLAWWINTHGTSAGWVYPAAETEGGNG
jgi:hypothetical protein